MRAAAPGGPAAARALAVLTIGALAAGAAGAAGAAVDAGTGSARTPPPHGSTSSPADASLAVALPPPGGAGALAPFWARADEVALTWLEPVAASGDRPAGHRLRFARLAGDRWQPAVTIAEGDLFANWADVPAAAKGAAGWVAHWLGRGGSGTYDYGIDLAVSPDGRAWRPTGRLHEDRTPTEHGFVSWIAEEDGLRAFWLDGRETGRGGAMTLRSAAVEAGRVGLSEVVDPRVCDCCGTAAVATSSGALVAYRDRGENELRDVSVRRRRGGAWESVRPLHRDGWVIAGCPVNGPSLASAGGLVYAAWYTEAEGSPRVLAAVSPDGGATFGGAATIDDQRPAGRVDVVVDPRGGAVVAWLGRAPAAPGSPPATEQGAILAARLGADGRVGRPLVVAAASLARASGFPRLRLDGDRLLFAWTEPAAGAASPSQVRVAALALTALP